jgi:cob(I)alamin adenosyltransferase
VQFLKNKASGEARSVKKLGVRVEQFGEGFYHRKNSEKHRVSALKALSFVKENLNDYSLVILDEVNVALSLGLLKLEEALPLLNADCELVLTGRDAPEELVEKADYVTFFEEVKHPFRKGAGAREGVEF